MASCVLQTAQYKNKKIQLATAPPTNATLNPIPMPITLPSMNPIPSEIAANMTVKQLTQIYI